MSRYGVQHSYGHRCVQVGRWYQLVWVVDRYYHGSRLRFPRRFSRGTDEAGARRFCKKWNIEMPLPPAPTGEQK